MCAVAPVYPWNFSSILKCGARSQSQNMVSSMFDLQHSWLLNLWPCRVLAPAEPPSTDPGPEGGVELREEKMLGTGRRQLLHYFSGTRSTFVLDLFVRW